MRILAVVLVVVLLVLQFTLWFGRGGQKDLRDLRETVAAQREEILVLQERNQTLAAEVQDLKQGLEAIEELARSEMGLIKEGEVFYQIIKPQAADSNGE